MAQNCAFFCSHVGRYIPQKKKKSLIYKDGTCNKWRTHMFKNVTFFFYKKGCIMHTPPHYSIYKLIKTERKQNSRIAIHSQKFPETWRYIRINMKMANGLIILICRVWGTIYTYTYTKWDSVITYILSLRDVPLPRKEH